MKFEQMGFFIHHPLIEFEIVIEDINKLRLHEEVLPDALIKLEDQIKRDGYLKHPVIVDINTYIVLDGVHRVVATKNIGCRFIPICLVDYKNPYIAVYNWYRTINGPSNFEKVVEIIKGLNFTIERCLKDHAHKIVNKREAIAALISNEDARLILGSSMSIKETYDMIKRIEIVLRANGFSINFETADDAHSKLINNEVLALLVTPSLSKEDIINTTLAGKVFAPKTTRHVIPARPLFINIPIEWLSGRMSLEEANNALVKYLSTKQLVLLTKGQILDRRYEEEIYIFR
ncbi:MAG: ParB N-terminal domain-containing protein [Nitrososphaerota archaeon]|nr:ParB N-terminal domain-containing protein [Nitrososphaerales archaeon]MDW8045053.1 ParB N-terminal domain-containing protein [Nitrososphaerota archaeon]